MRRPVGTTFFAAALLSLIVLPFARPQAMVWVESDSGAWFVVEGLSGSLCLPSGGPLEGAAGGHAFCGLCVVGAAAGLPPQPGPAILQDSAAPGHDLHVAGDDTCPAAVQGLRPPVRAPPPLPMV